MVYPVQMKATGGRAKHTGREMPNWPVVSTIGSVRVTCAAGHICDAGAIYDAGVGRRPLQRRICRIWAPGEATNAMAGVKCRSLPPGLRECMMGAAR